MMEARRRCAKEDVNDIVSSSFAAAAREGKL